MTCYNLSFDFPLILYYIKNLNSRLYNLNQYIQLNLDDNFNYFP